MTLPSLFNKIYSLCVLFFKPFHWHALFRMVHKQEMFVSCDVYMVNLGNTLHSEETNRKQNSVTGQVSTVY
jgi:hypothetical protein